MSTSVTRPMSSYFMFHQRYHEQGLPLKRMMLAVHFVYKKPNHDASPDILTLLVENSKSPWSR
ncbi:hypothetical protein NEOLEDRAFT_1127428 [Neolentinus lepideus HHB14362 ss-1]|uniref:Uncharacterized protein n=1 Tax=Neolentinus lepideus HHB14362 ss-1 TaxID=1314782 RepID=A0A165VH66_9AGAM|nr:hypothetical protein NEOLEDRAFT_1127428 [Neolentinus lepideus HHB14362 ss-1]